MRFFLYTYQFTLHALILQNDLEALLASSPVLDLPDREVGWEPNQGWPRDQQRPPGQSGRC